MIQKMAWAFGVFFLLLGILGLVPSLAPGESLFGTFAVDVMGNAVYLLTGALAILAAWGSGLYARLYFKVFGLVYAIVTVIGFISGDTILGLMTVNTADNFLHLLIALIALWAGFGAKPDTRMQERVTI